MRTLSAILFYGCFKPLFNYVYFESFTVLKPRMLKKNFYHLYLSKLFFILYAYPSCLVCVLTRVQLPLINIINDSCY